MITHLFAPTKKRAENNAVHAKTYLRGLLSETPRKNSEAIADVADDTQAQDIQNFMTGSQWEYDDVFAHAATLLSTRDVVQLLDWYFRASPSLESVIEQVEKRHRRRKSASESKIRISAKTEKTSRSIH